MKHSAITAAMVVLLATTGWFAGVGASADPASTTASPTSTQRRLSDAAPSIDVLLDRFLDALERRDTAALRTLRVTEQEYRTLVVPGTVERGKPLLVIDDDSTKFYWDMLNTKSLYAEAAILRNFGGRRLKLKGVQYLKGEMHFASYDAYGTASLTLEDDAGEIHELTLGSIANVDGQYKFIGMLGDS